jgi:hypothetical protein
MSAAIWFFHSSGEEKSFAVTTLKKEEKNGLFAPGSSFVRIADYCCRGLGEQRGHLSEALPYGSFTTEAGKAESPYSGANIRSGSLATEEVESARPCMSTSP